MSASREFILRRWQRSDRSHPRKSRSHARRPRPVVILVEERAAYMDLLARSDYDGLAAMLRRLSEAETERMERFAEL